MAVEEDSKTMHISGLYTYPLKSGKGASLQQAWMENTGIRNDRRWVLVDTEGRFITQRELPRMGKISLEPSERQILAAWGEESIIITRPSPEEPSTVKRTVQIWKDQVIALDCGDEIADFLSLKLEKSVRLYEAYEQRVIANPDIPLPNSHYLFADSYPYMILGQGSLESLNIRLQEQNLNPAMYRQFRPNILISDLAAHDEDQIDSLHIGEHVELRFGKLCSRCNIVNIDPNTDELGSQPLKTLASYRKIQGHKIYFGVNMWLFSGHGLTIQVGDPVKIRYKKD